MRQNIYCSRTSKDALGQTIYVLITFLSNTVDVLPRNNHILPKNIALVSESLNNKIPIRLGCYEELLTLIGSGFELSKVNEYRVIVIQS